MPEIHTLVSDIPPDSIRVMRDGVPVWEKAPWLSGGLIDLNAEAEREIERHCRDPWPEMPISANDHEDIPRKIAKTEAFLDGIVLGAGTMCVLFLLGWLTS